jgi:Co-chaperonin GroES (HSP10)
MSNLSIRPLADRVVIEPAVAEQKTASGIIIPDTAKEKPQRGIVVAVGPGTKENAVTLKIGDNVFTANTPAQNSPSTEKIT